MSNSPPVNANPEDSPIVRGLRKIPCAGLGLGLLSGAVFSSGSFLVKKMPEINPIEMVLCRSIITLIVYVPVILMQRSSLCAKGERLTLFYRGFFGFISFSMAYYAFKLIPLADASTIVFSAPVFVSIFAYFILKEACGWFQISMIAVTMVGVLLISKPTFIFGGSAETDGTKRTYGLICACISAIGTSIAYIMVRKIKKTPPLVIIIMFSSVCMIMSIATLLVIWFAFGERFRLPNEWNKFEYLYLFLNSVAGVLGQLFLTIALRIEEAGLVSLSRTIDIVLAFVFGIVLLGEPVIWTSVLGALIVCCSVIITGVRKWMMGKRERAIKKIESSEMQVRSIAMCVERNLALNNLPNLATYENMKADKTT